MMSNHRLKHLSQRKDGGYVGVVLTLMLLIATAFYRKGKPELVRSIASLVDITERRQMEQRVSYLNRVLQAIHKVNQFIVYERNRDRLLDRITELLVDTRGYYNAWI